jgi:hypothetical protein
MTDSEFTIDDYIEAKTCGVDIVIPEYDQYMDELKIGGLSMTDLCSILCDGKKTHLPDFHDYVVNRGNMPDDNHVVIYDKIIRGLILKQQPDI